MGVMNRLAALREVNRLLILLGVVAMGIRRQTKIP